MDGKIPREANTAAGGGLAAARPKRGLAIVTCMDARIDPLVVFGLETGDAHILRNAGARVTDDTVRSLAVSCRLAGVRHVWLLQHSGCAMAAPSDKALRRRFVSGSSASVDVPLLSIDDHVQALRRDLRRLRSEELLPAGVVVAGGILHLETGAIETVDGDLPQLPPAESGVPF